MSFYFYNGYERTFGTFPLKGDDLKYSVINAVEVGYRSFDTAQMYNNESDLGQILNDLKLSRDQICLTSKVLPGNYKKKLFLKSVEKTLKDLKTDYLDVLLLHWPDPIGDNAESLEELQKALEKQYTKNIGISNYTIAMMRDALVKLSSLPVTNQVEFHPLLDSSKLLDAANKIGIPLSAYCSLAKGKIKDVELLREIGNLYNRTPTQIALRWTLQKGVSLNTMSTKKENIYNNFNIMDFSLSGADIIKIDNCMKQNYRIVDKKRMPIAPEWD